MLQRILHPTVIFKLVLLVFACLGSACNDPKPTDKSKEQRINPISIDRIREARKWVDENLSNHFLVCGEATFTYYNGKLVWFVNLKTDQLFLDPAPTLFGSDDPQSNNVVYRGKIKLVAKDADKPIQYRTYNTQKGKWEGDGDNFASDPFGEYPQEFEIICQGTPGKTDEKVRCDGLWVKIDEGSGATKFPYKAIHSDLARNCQRLKDGIRLDTAGWTHEEAKLLAEINQYQKGIETAKASIAQIEKKYGEAEIRSRGGYVSIANAGSATLTASVDTDSEDKDNDEGSDKRLKRFTLQRDELKTQYELVSQELDKVKEAQNEIIKQKKNTDVVLGRNEPNLDPLGGDSSSSSQTKLLSIELCAISELLPVKGLCTRTVWKKFSSGKEPTRSCNRFLH